MSSKSQPQHYRLHDLPVVGDELRVGGTALSALATQMERTPFYLYDKDAISERVKQLRRELPDGLVLRYAVKANPMPEVVSLLASLVDGLDIASEAEMGLALATGIAPHEVSFAGPGKRWEELRAAVEAGVVTIIESHEELQRIAKIASDLGTEPKVAIRINPHFELRGSALKMGGGSKAFGVDYEEVPDLLRRAKRMALSLVGLQIYAGSQCLDAKAIGAACRETFKLAARIHADTGIAIPQLNIGGGLGIPYFPGQLPLDLSRLGQILDTELKQLQTSLPDTRVIMELGRYLVGEAGYFVCAVNYRKVSRGEIYLITDGGLHHHLAASGNLGQVLRRNYPLITAHRVYGDPRETVNVVGPLCTPLDVLGHGVTLGRADIGDHIVILQSGAYGRSASPLGFLSHPPPLERLV